jgi:hypothetical protein
LKREGAEAEANGLWALNTSSDTSQLESAKNFDCRLEVSLERKHNRKRFRVFASEDTDVALFLFLMKLKL